MLRLYKAANIRIYIRNMHLCMITRIESCVLADCVFVFAYMDKCLTLVYTVMRFYYFDYAATKQTASTYCNYNRWQLASLYTLYFITNNGHMKILALYRRSADCFI